jgi:hypothetical protein
MIVVVLLVGGWLGWIVRSARIQREAVAAIRAAGGWVEHDFQSFNGQWDSDGRPRAPRCLVDLIGIDFFGHVTTVGLTAKKAAIEIAHVGRLTRLKRLSLYGSSVRDADLAHLKRLGELTYLDLDRAQLTNSSLVHLKELTQLTYLDLEGARVTDAGLTHLKRLTNLAYLDLRDTKVTDAGVKELQQSLPRLAINH